MVKIDNLSNQKKISRYVMSKRVTMLNDAVVAEILLIRRKCNALKMVSSRSLIWCNMQEYQWPPGTKGVKHNYYFAVSQDPCGVTVFPDCTVRFLNEWRY
jgi:hypothetical protein